MAQPKNESSTTLNAGTGGDAIRDLVMTQDDGTTVKQQVVSIGDPIDIGQIMDVTERGAARTEDYELRVLLQHAVAELRLIRIILQSNSSEEPDPLEALDATGDIN